MAFEFLNHTTYENDDLVNGNLQQQILQRVYEQQMQEQMLAEQANTTNPGEGLHDHTIDPDLADLINNNAEAIYKMFQNPDEKVDDNSDINPNDFDFTNDNVTADDMELYGYLFDDSSQMPNSSRTPAYDVSHNQQLSPQVPVANQGKYTVPDTQDEENDEADNVDENQSTGSVPKAQVGGLFSSNKPAYADSVLNAHKDLEWVNRLYQDNTPSIQVPGQRYKSTHLMADDGNGYVFPSIQTVNGHLQYLGDRAEDYARETNTGIQLPKEQGTWFANNGYKQGHGVLKRIQYGGSTLVADTPNRLYTGLNDSSYEHAVLNLAGHNIIRGLDNNHPVAVTDGSKYRVLYGKHDTDTFHGKVYESKI